jgi:multidrug resistance efflux pump/hemolysin secretion transmembrane protein, putative
MDMNKNAPLTDYLRKYRQQKDRTLKYDFMPSLLEIVERPAHIAGKWIIILISLLLLVVLLWASLSRINVVVVGTGEIVPEEQVQSVSSLTNGIVKSMNVKEGDQVEKGTTILELDDAVTKQNVGQLENSLTEINASIAVIQKYQADKNVSIQLSDYDSSAQNVVQSLISENNLYRQQLSQADANLVTAQYETSLAQKMATLTENKRKTETDLAQQHYILEHLAIKAPSTGQIASLSVSYIGQNISSENPIVTILPSKSELIFEAQVSDKDRADIQKDMEAVVKLQAYPYSDYGTIPGKVTYISPTAFQVKGKGMVYIVRISVDKEKLHKGVKLISGLSGTIEIKTSSRSVLDYFLDPIRDGLNGSLKEK